MKNYFVLGCLVLLVASCGTSEDPLVSAQKRYPMLKPCNPEGLNEKILCGSIEVFENQINKSGRKIPLNVFLFPSYRKDPPQYVFVDYNGGPGVPNNLLVPYYEKGGFSSFFREVRDVLIVEKRGTGASRISCDALDSISLPIDHYLFDTELIADCLSEIQGKVDLSKYDTEAQVEDLEQVRNWMKIETYDFHGISYGSRVGLELIRRYPKSINSAILTGTVPPEFGLFGYVDIEMERVLRKLIARCETDSICSTHFPGFKEEVYELRNSLQNNPVTYDYVNEASGKQHQIRFTESVYLGMMAGILNGGSKIEQIPAIINEAHSENFTPLIEANISSLQLAIPLHLSQLCPEEANKFSETFFASMDTLFTKGMGALTEFRACQAWQELSTPDWMSKPIGGNTPLLLFSGEDDVLTPPRMNHTIHQLFPNSKHIIFKDQGHTYTDWSCWDQLVYQFLENNGEVNELDTSCVKEITRPTFSTN